MSWIKETTDNALEETEQAISDVEHGKIKRFSSVESLFDDLENDEK